MTTLQDIKKDLPGWPDDVIDQWLLKLANQSGMGWPPPNPMTGHRWVGWEGRPCRALR
jgi:hypothetical protein